jgi:hypothetical protein
MTVIPLSAAINSAILIVGENPNLNTSNQMRYQRTRSPMRFCQRQTWAVPFRFAPTELATGERMQTLRSVR